MTGKGNHINPICSTNGDKPVPQTGIFYDQIGYYLLIKSIQNRENRDLTDIFDYRVYRIPAMYYKNGGD